MNVDVYPTQHKAITPSDTAEHELTGLYVGVSGDLNVVLRHGTNAELYLSVPIGDFPRAVKKVMATGTTATNLIGQM